MALSFTEDLGAFFDIPGFTVPVVSGDVTDVGYFDSPTETIADGLVLTTDFSVLVITAKFPSLKAGDSITVDSVDYTVREPIMLDDGKLTRVYMLKD